MALDRKKRATPRKLDGPRKLSSLPRPAENHWRAPRMGVAVAGLGLSGAGEDRIEFARTTMFATMDWRNGPIETED